MKFAIANTFQKALQKLEAKDAAAAKLAKQSAFDFQMNPVGTGFSFERFTKSKDPSFWSLRVTDGIRIIAHRSPDLVTMCYVDRHAEAYKWAERRRFEVHLETGAVQIVEIRETIKEITKVIEKQVRPPLFAGLTLITYLLWGYRLSGWTRSDLFPKTPSRPLSDIVTSKKAVNPRGQRRRGNPRSEYFLTWYTRSPPSVFVDSILRPCFLAAVERKPRLLCACQSVAFTESTNKCTRGEA